MSDANRRAARTVVQFLVAVAALLPAIVDGAGLSRSLPWVAGALTVAGVTSRLMSLAAAQHLLPPWLRVTGPIDGTTDGTADGTAGAAAASPERATGGRG
jgi:hypothetical protein